MLKHSIRVFIEGKSAIDGVDVASFSASVSSNNPNNIVFSTRQLDQAACKEHRVEVRADEAAFSDYAYSVQDKMLAEFNQQ